MTTTAQKIASKLAQAEAINNTLTLDMSEDIFKSISKALLRLQREAINETADALESRDITFEEGRMLRRMTLESGGTDIKETF